LGQTARKRAATLCQVKVFPFSVSDLSVVPDTPVIYWWDEKIRAQYRSAERVGTIAPIRYGLSTQNNARWLRSVWEITFSRVMLRAFSESRAWDGSDWVPYVKGAAGASWLDSISDVLLWRLAGAELWAYPENRWGRGTDFYFQPGVAFVNIGASFSARAYRVQSIFGHVAGSIFGMGIPDAVCLLNSSVSRKIMESLNPTLHFLTTDVERLPYLPISAARDIFAQVESAFTIHESHREPSVEFRTPGPSPWRHAQEWAQLAVDRPENTPLSPYEEQLDPEPPTDHLSFALGVTLGRFDPNGAGILDPQTANLGHALPHGLLFLDGTLEQDSARDGLGRPAATILHTAWSTHSANLDTKRKHLRDYLRLDFFDVHRSMYENRPIHWPLSSAKKTFVAWINIHRWHANTLRILLADHLLPTKQRLDTEVTELRKVRDGTDKKAARNADKRLDSLTAWRDELDEFIANVTACAEQGPPQPDAKTPKRTDDAPYDPDLDDGVMINSAALWPLLTPQWKDPKKWWTELAKAEGRKDYDWSHLAARYFKKRVDAKCKKDPSLAVAHGCFWKYHPERAYAWELRLQEEIGPDFTIDEPDSAEARTQFLAEHSQTAQAILEKELHRRARKQQKSNAESQTETEFDDEPEHDDA
jgi:hypothetical protein